MIIDAIEHNNRLKISKRLVATQPEVQIISFAVTNINIIERLFHGQNFLGTQTSLTGLQSELSTSLGLLVVLEGAPSADNLYVCGSAS